MGQAGCANGRVVTATPERLTEGGEVWAGPGHGHAAGTFDWQNRELSVGKGPDALGGAAWRRTASTRQTAWGVSWGGMSGTGPSRRLSGHGFERMGHSVPVFKGLEKCPRAQTAGDVTEDKHTGTFRVA